MSGKKLESFAGKHTGKDVTIDEQISVAIREKAVNGEISCSNVMAIAKKLNKGIEVVGVNVDLLELHINKCQLGLFGYKPESRIVKAAASVSPELEEMIRKSLKDGCLPCIAAWNIADTQKIPRMDVACACEKLSIKIKPCQIGAF